MQGEATLFDDCANVVKDMSRDRKQHNQEGSVYASLMMKVGQWDPEAKLSIQKVKAHVTISELEGEKGGWRLATTQPTNLRTRPSSYTHGPGRR